MEHISDLQPKTCPIDDVTVAIRYSKMAATSFTFHCRKWPACPFYYILLDPANRGLAIHGPRVFASHKVWPVLTFAVLIIYLFIYVHTSGLLVSSIHLENWKSANITALHKKEQKQIPLIAAQWAYYSSNHQQSNAIHHCSWHKIIHFLQQPHLMSSIPIQTSSLYLGHAASTLPTMVEDLNIRHEMRTVSLDINSGILACSKNCLPMESKANSTLGWLTSSTLIVNVWLSMKPFLLLSLSMRHLIPNLHQWSLWLWKALFMSLLMIPFSAMTSLILLTDRQQPLPSPQTLTKITNWSNTILFVYAYWAPFVFSLTPHRYLHPLSDCVCSPSAMLVFSPFSCFSLCYVVSWFVLCNRSSTRLDHVIKKKKTFTTLAH